MKFGHQVYIFTVCEALISFSSTCIWFRSIIGITLAQNRDAQVNVPREMSLYKLLLKVVRSKEKEMGGKSLVKCYKVKFYEHNQLFSIWYVRRERWTKPCIRARLIWTRRIYIQASPSSLVLEPNESYFPGSKTAGAWICPLVTIWCQVKNEWSCTSTFLTCFGECTGPKLLFAVVPACLLKPDLRSARLWSHVHRKCRLQNSVISTVQLSFFCRQLYISTPLWQPVPTHCIHTSFSSLPVCSGLIPTIASF